MRIRWVLVRFHISFLLHIDLVISELNFHSKFRRFSFCHTGKSLSCVSLLYAVMAQPSLFDSEMGRGVIHKCLLVVPVNTLANWENEFEKWTKGLEKKEKLDIFNVSSAEKYGRHRMIEHWSRVGGILLTSVGLFRSMAGRKDIEKLLSGTDVIVLDERYVLLFDIIAILLLRTSHLIIIKSLNYVNCW